MATLLSGNKMSLLLFLFGFILIFFLIKNLRFVISLSLFIFVFVFVLLVNYDSYEGKNYYKNSYRAFINDINIKKFIKIKKGKLTKRETEVSEELEETTGKPKEIVLLRHSGYNRLFQTAITMWKEQPIFGFGYKSFRIKCWYMLVKDNIERETTKKSQKIACGNHPHNYYLELLSEAGIVGTSLIIVFFLILLKDSFYFLKEYNSKINSEITLIIPIIIAIFLEIWPLRSSGSFFTTGNATFLWLLVGILLATNVRNRISKS